MTISEPAERPNQDRVLGVLTTDELIRELNISKRTFRRWESLRIGPRRTKIGNQIFYRIEAVRKWLRDRESGIYRGYAKARNPKFKRT